MCLLLVTKGQSEEMEGATAVAVPGVGEEEEQSSSPLPACCEAGAAQTSSAFGEAKSRSEQHPLAGLSQRQRGCACGLVRRAVNAHEWLCLFNPFLCVASFQQFEMGRMQCLSRITDLLT